MVTEFCMLAPNISGSSVWNLLYVALLAPGILRWLLDIWKICATLLQVMVLRDSASMKLRQNQCNILLMVTRKGLNLYTAGVEIV